MNKLIKFDCMEHHINGNCLYCLLNDKKRLTAQLATTAAENKGLVDKIAWWRKECGGYHKANQELQQYAFDTNVAKKAAEDKLAEMGAALKDIRCTLGDFVEVWSKREAVVDAIAKAALAKKGAIE